MLFELRHLCEKFPITWSEFYGKFLRNGAELRGGQESPSPASDRSGGVDPKTSPKIILMRRRNAIPRNEREAQARERALAAVARMRRKKLSLSAAAQAEHTNPRTVQRYVGTALRQEEPGRHYRATTYDRIPRTLHVVTPEGTLPVTVRDSRTASRIGEYMNAVRTYVNKGESSGLERFRGKSFRADGVSYPFVTDPNKLEELADAGVLAVEQLYRATQGMTA